MRVALMCDYSLEYLGGAQTAFIQQARVLADAGHHVTVIAPRPMAPLPELENQSGIDLQPVDFPLTLPGVGLPLIANTAAVRRRVAAILADSGAQVLHSHSEFGLTRAGFTAARGLGLPVVQTVHTFFWQALGPFQAPAARGLRLFYRWLTQAGMSNIALGERAVDTALRNMTLTTALLADAVVSPSAHQGGRLREAGLADVVVIPNTFRIDEEATPVPARSPMEPLKLAWIGRCVEEKRLLPFIESIRRATQLAGPGRFEVTVIGDGLQLGQARHAARSVPEVAFLGRVDGSTVREHIARSHLTCLTSHGFDNQPMTVVESILLGRGVFYVDPKLREGLSTCGVLAESPEVEDMARALVRIADEPRIAEELSAAAATAAREFLPSSFAAASVALYGRLIAGGGAGASQPRR